MTGRLVNGLALVVVGAILLMNTTGYLPWSVWDAAVSYWPILLIGLGLQAVLGKRGVPVFALAVVLVLILGAMNPLAGSAGSWFRRNGGKVEFRFPGNMWRSIRPMENTRVWTVPLKPSVSEIHLETKAPSLELEARGDPGLNEKPEPEAMSAELSWDRREPAAELRETDKEVTAQISAPDAVGSDAGKQVWDISLNPSLVTSVDVSGGVANVTLDCGSVLLKEANISAGVVDLDLALGLTGKETRVNVTGGAASISLSVPRSAGLRVTLSSPLTITHDLGEEGLTRSGNAWTTPEFEDASTKIEVAVKCGAGTIKVNRTD